MILWFIKILRLFCAFLDKIAYTLIALIYELFMLISQAGIFSQATIQEFATRIYVFLGLIMVFKVSISLVTYILNPDNFNKADVGAPALLKGFAFALFGIVLVPYVFEAAYSLQNIVLKDNIIGNLIMGMSDDSKNSDDYIRDAGIDMSFVTLTAFIRLDTQFPQISEACAANPVKVTQASTVDAKGTGELTTECSELEEVLGAEGVQLLIDAYVNRSISNLTDGDLLNVTSKLDDKDEFVMNYLPIISTAAGVFIAYVILLFCVDIAVRSVKLGFLQLIAPIPLIAKVDPKKGGKIFDNWMGECVSTYLDVFLRLAAIYFVLFIISAITTSGNSGIYNVVTGEGFSGVSGIFVKIFIIIGALNFARDLPKLLSKILGIDLKGSGGFTLDAKKKFGATPLLGGALVGGAGLAGRTGMNLGKGLFNAAGSGVGALDNATGFNKWREKKADAFKNSSFGQGLSRVGNGIDNLGAAAGRTGRAVNSATGGAMSRIGEDFGDVGSEFSNSVQNSLGMLNSKEAALIKKEADIAQAQTATRSIMEKNKTMIASNDAVEARAKKKVAESSDYIRKQQDIDNLKQQLKNAMSSSSPDQTLINKINDDIVDKTSSFNKWANKDGVYDYINNTKDDAVLTSLVSKRDETAKVLGMANDVVDKEASAVSDYASSLQTTNTGYEAGFVRDDQELSRIKDEKRQISEQKRTGTMFTGNTKK